MIVFKDFNCVYMLGVYVHVYRCPESEAVVTGEYQPREVGIRTDYKTSARAAFTSPLSCLQAQRIKVLKFLPNHLSLKWLLIRTINSQLTFLCK